MARTVEIKEDKVPKPRDQFGFIVGSKKSEAAALYVEKATTQSEIKSRLGGTYLNLLYEVAEQGHRIEKSAHNTYYGEIQYRIIPNPEFGGRVPWYDLTTENLLKLGFVQQRVSPLVIIWLIPVYLKGCIPSDLKLVDRHSFRSGVGKGGNIEKYSFQIKRTPRGLGNNYLDIGVLAKS